MGLRTHLLFAAVGLSALAAPAIAQAQDGAHWDQARNNLVASQPGRMAYAVSRWESLQATTNGSFADYAGFITTYPGFPQQEKLQQRAEAALDREAPTPQALVAFFDRNKPITNSARARYALALGSLGRPEAFDVARAAWRGGTMSSAAEAYIQGMYGARMTPADQDARMDALLWQSNSEAAARQIAFVSPQMCQLAMARLSLVQRSLPEQAGITVPIAASSDPGYVYNRVRQMRGSGNLGSAVDLLANRPSFGAPAFDAEDYIGEALSAAKGAGAEPAVRIASKVDDLFAPGADVSKESYRLRDDYTSLMWLGGTKALWQLGDGRRAAPLFYRYGTAAQTTPTRSKGFYWAGLASKRAGDSANARRYFEMAAAYPDRFYGQLALRELGKPVPALDAGVSATPSSAQRASFEAMPIVAAVREVARDAPWKTGVQFYRELADQATTREEHAMVAELARQIGRRDLAVILADSAASDGLAGFTAQGYPVMPVPGGTDWTMVHAITRQESQFAQNALSHAGAQGLMQLMPGTAREQAGKLGMNYMSADLINSPSYNIQLGNGYFARMMDYFRGSYPLAVAAYNAGPGNVNKWLAANGDPRNGSVQWVDWIERIPLYETKNYVQRVLENAAVYEQLNPGQVRYGKPRTVSDFLR